MSTGVRFSSPGDENGLLDVAISDPKGLRSREIIPAILPTKLEDIQLFQNSSLERITQ